MRIFRPDSSGAQLEHSWLGFPSHCHESPRASTTPSHSRAPRAPAMAHFQHTCNACLKPICEGDVYITRCGHRFCERPRDRDLLDSSPSSLLAPLPSSRARARRLTTSAPPAVCTQATTTREGCVRRASARRAARRCTGRRISRCGACPDRPTPSCAFFEPLFQPSGVRRSAWRRGQRGPPRVRPGHDHDRCV